MIYLAPVQNVMTSWSTSGAQEAKDDALKLAISVLRQASRGQKVTKSDVEVASALVQAGGRTVMPMDYFHARGGSAVPLPQAFFGRPSLTCGPGVPQCGGAQASPTASEIKDAATLEGIKMTPHALRAATAVAADRTRVISKLLRHDHPRSKQPWTASQVRKAIS